VGEKESAKLRESSGQELRRRRRAADRAAVLLAAGTLVLVAYVAAVVAERPPPFWCQVDFWVFWTAAWWRLIRWRDRPSPWEAP
jgi:hypothetical protein